MSKISYSFTCPGPPFGLVGPAGRGAARDPARRRGRKRRKSSIAAVSDNVTRLLVGIGGALGGVALVRFLRRRSAPAPPPAPHPAESLRAKLDESRVVADDRDEFESGETPVDEADPDARRRALHEQARAQLDELSATDEN